MSRYILEDEADVISNGLIVPSLHSLMENPEQSLTKISGMKDRTILINGFSKNFAMTGWRLGYAFAHKEIMGQMTKVHQYAIMCAPTVSQYAAVEAMKNGEADAACMRESYDQRRRYLFYELEHLGLPCFEPEGAFYTKEFGLIPFKSRKRYPLYFKVDWKNSFSTLGRTLCMANGMTEEGCYKLNVNKKKYHTVQ